MNTTRPFCGIRNAGVGRFASIPTGLRHSAQSCPRRRTTLGQPFPKNYNPNGNLCKSRVCGDGARVCDPQRVDLQGHVLRLTEPRSTFAEISNGVASVRRHQRIQPFQGCSYFDLKPQVAPCAQPWAEGWNPVGMRTGGQGSRVPECNHFAEAVLKNGISRVAYTHNQTVGTPGAPR
jgi:hypothetical protein